MSDQRQGFKMVNYLLIVCCICLSVGICGKLEDAVLVKREREIQRQRDGTAKHAKRD